MSAAQPSAVAPAASMHWTKLGGFAEAMDDPTNQDHLLAELDKVCTDWESEHHPLTLQVIYEAPADRIKQFKQWLQDIILTQSEGFPGYQGTLLYTPCGLKGAMDRNKETITVVEARYNGAKNFKAWLESQERERAMAPGQVAGLWDPSKTRCRILEGRDLTMDCVWNETASELEAHEESAGQGRRQELSKARLVAFTDLSVWFAILLLSWPVGGLADSTIGALGYPGGVCVAQFVVVILVQWVVVPCLQPLVARFLVRPHPSKNSLWSKEPLRTLDEGFPCFQSSWLRKRKHKGSSAAKGEHLGEPDKASQRKDSTKAPVAPQGDIEADGSQPSSSMESRTSASGQVPAAPGGEALKISGEDSSPDDIVKVLTPLACRSAAGMDVLG
mmetsp:Transcript_7913/g.22663  ORF Transcript_7913/g.22663 Transcript_7913/m.22663 type:complete len:388 (+) Transcript_7913:139-1302(+)